MTQLFYRHKIESITCKLQLPATVQLNDLMI